jgi:hypothetical protein
LILIPWRRVSEKVGITGTPQRKLGARAHLLDDDARPKLEDAAEDAAFDAFGTANVAVSQSYRQEALC